MESIKDSLTNEKLKKKFTSQFELVNYAIRLAENMIKSGRGPRVKTDVQNLALQILEEIAAGKDQFDELYEQTHMASTDFHEPMNQRDSHHREHREHRDNFRERRDGDSRRDDYSQKNGEKKKPRKILAD